MQKFKETYLQACQQNDIEPLQNLLDNLAFPKGSSAQIPDSLLSSIPAPLKSTNLKQDKAPVYYDQTLNLSNQTITPKMAKALALALENDQVFTCINLADCLLGDDGSIHLANALKTNSKVETLDMKGNNIRADGSIAISQMIKVNSSLKQISLEWNCLGIWEVSIVAFSDALSINHVIEDVDLRNNRIGPEAMVTLASGLKMNSGIRRLDLRWNSIGIRGGRALLDCLKWNTTLLVVEIQGNQVPDDLSRAIDMALERNRQNHRLNEESSTKVKYLSNTLQQLSVEHEESIQGLQSRLVASEIESRALGSKLTMATDEIESSHMGYKVMETKLAEEKALRERTEQRLSEMEMVMTTERREFAEKCKEFMNDMIREREERKILEENHRLSRAQETEKLLTVEAKMKEAELREDRVSRYLKDMESEVKRLKKEKDDVEVEVSAYKRKLKQDQLELESDWKLRFASLTEQLAAMTKLLEREKQISCEKDGEMKIAEGRIRQEERQKANEIIGKLQSVSQHRDILQQSLNTLKSQSKLSQDDFESRLKSELETNENLKREAVELKKRNVSLEEEMQSLRALSSTFHKRQDDMNCALRKTEDENRRLLVEIEELVRKLDSRREDEISRAKELERAVSSYVKSICKS